jgi:hypothetical protein
MRILELNPKIFNANSLASAFAEIEVCDSGSNV